MFTKVRTFIPFRIYKRDGWKQNFEKNHRPSIVEILENNGTDSWLEKAGEITPMNNKMFYLQRSMMGELPQRIVVLGNG